jgi:hypothetical protein
MPRPLPIKPKMFADEKDKHSKVGSKEIESTEKEKAGSLILF